MPAAQSGTYAAAQAENLYIASNMGKVDLEHGNLGLSTQQPHVAKAISVQPLRQHPAIDRARHAAFKLFLLANDRTAATVVGRAWLTSVLCKLARIDRSCGHVTFAAQLPEQLSVVSDVASNGAQEPCKTSSVVWDYVDDAAKQLRVFGAVGGEGGFSSTSPSLQGGSPRDGASSEAADSIETIREYTNDLDELVQVLTAILHGATIWV